MYSLFGIQKLKTMGHIAAAANHQLRQRPTPNADPARSIQILRGSEDPVEDFRKLLPENRRLNAVLGWDIFLGASPEYFGRPWDQGKIEAWTEASMKWLDMKFGADTVVSATLHLDETTPHIQALVIPLDNGKLNARRITGGPAKLRKLHTEYAQACAHLGLKRGLEGSKATHTKIGQYYDLVNSMNVDEVPAIPTPPAFGREAWAEKQTDELRSELAPVLAKAQQHELSVRREKELRDTASLIALERDSAQAQRDRYKEQLSELRGISLEKVLEDSGAAWRKDKDAWDINGKLLRVSKGKFYDLKSGEKGGGAIDLVKLLQQCDFTTAVQWLADNYGEHDAIETAGASARTQAMEQAKRAAAAPLQAPKEIPENWHGAFEYLTGERALPDNMIDALHDRGDVYADDHKNVVFARYDLAGEVVGYVLTGTGETRFKGNRGPKSAGGYWIGSDTARNVFVCESPIDVLSAWTLHKRDGSTDYLYVSSDGTGRLCPDFLRGRANILSGFDNDDAGNKHHEQLLAQLNELGIKTPVHRILPRAKDWNKDLQDLRSAQNSPPAREARPARRQEKVISPGT